MTEVGKDLLRNSYKKAGITMIKEAIAALISGQSLAIRTGCHRLWKKS